MVPIKIGSILTGRLILMPKMCFWSHYTHESSALWHDLVEACKRHLFWQVTCRIRCNLTSMNYVARHFPHRDSQCNTVFFTYFWRELLPKTPIFEGFLKSFGWSPTLPALRAKGGPFFRLHSSLLNISPELSVSKRLTFDLNECT